jgi:ectoine hydroxylase-related dioxygenase (phytanoyl-CoA dioxygenase family)
MLQISDPRERAAFERDGYFVRRILDEETAERLRAKAESLVRGKDANHAPDSNYYSLLDEDAAVALEVSQLAWQAWAGPMEQIASDWQPVQSGLSVKLPGGSNTHLHVHPPVTDNPFGTSVIGWCALADYDEQSGCLYVIPRSHHLLRYINTVGGGFLCDVDFADRIVSDHAVPVPLKAGEALFFDNSLLHGAFANTKPQYRYSMGVLVADADETLATYRLGDNGVVVTAQPVNSYAVYAAAMVDPDPLHEPVLRHLPDWRTYPNYAQIDALLRANGRRASEDYDPFETVRHLADPLPAPPAPPERLSMRQRARHVARRIPGARPLYRTLKAMRGTSPVS